MPERGTMHTEPYKTYDLFRIFTFRISPDSLLYEMNHLLKCES